VSVFGSNVGVEFWTRMSIGTHTLRVIEMQFKKLSFDGCASIIVGWAIQESILNCCSIALPLSKAAHEEWEWQVFNFHF